MHHEHGSRPKPKRLVTAIHVSNGLVTNWFAGAIRLPIETDNLPITSVIEPVVVDGPVKQRRVGPVHFEELDVPIIGPGVVGVAAVADAADAELVAAHL